MMVSNTLQTIKEAYGVPTYTYVIHNDDLGLYYIGKHAGVWADGPDYYMGSSSYLNAVRAVFSEYIFQKDLLAQFPNDEQALTYETREIEYCYKTNPEGLLNRSANNAMGQFEHIGYGKITLQSDKDRLDAARNVVRPKTLKDGDCKCLILVKKADGTAHAPAMPWSDLTPIPKFRTWSPEMLEKYYSLPAGPHHFACVVSVKNGKENYRPLIYVESFENEEIARVRGCYYSHLPSAEYVRQIS